MSGARAFTPGSTILLLLALVTAIVVPVVFGDAPQDDAYITYVYARNFARGDGLVFNAGEPAVEGYVNFLWAIAIGWGMQAGLDPERVVPWVGLLLTLLTVVATYSLARRLGSSPWFAALAALVFSTRPSLAVHAMSGMETPLFGLLVLLGLLTRLGKDAERGRGWTSSVFLTLAALTRPEGILVYGLLELGDLLPALRGRAPLAAALRRALVRAIPFAVVVVAHLVWRRATYGDWIPNVFHAKVSPGPATWADGLRYAFYGLVCFGPVFVALPYATPAAPGFGRGRRLGLLVCTVHLAYVAYVGGDYIPSYRFLWPLMPIWSALFAAALSELTGHDRGRAVRASGLALALLFVHTAFEYVDGHRWAGMDARHRELVAAGRKLDLVLREDAWIAATNVGRIPYFADRRAIDMMGLNDAHIARVEMAAAPELAGHLKGDGGYVLDRAPDVILFLRLVLLDAPLANAAGRHAAIRAQAFGVSEREIAADRRFREQYRLYSLPLPDEGVWLNLFARDGAFAGELPAGTLVEQRGGT